MICTKCSNEGEFSYRNKQQSIAHKICKHCQKDYTDKYYDLNKEAHIEKNKEFVKLGRKELHSIIDKLKEAPCTDCKNTYPPYVMDYDHLEPTLKFKEISRMILNRFQLHKILDEINKCELVCSNCHRIRGHKRRIQGKMPESGLSEQS